MHGQGTKNSADGTMYVGEWKDDKMHGQGLYIYGEGEWEGDKYVGEWKDDKKNGKGIYTWADGKMYEGEWKSGLMNGQGTATNSDGIILHSGLWKDGKPVK